MKVRLYLSLKVSTTYKSTQVFKKKPIYYLFLAVIFMTQTGCSLFKSGQSSDRPNHMSTLPSNLFNIPAQIIADESIRSIQLHRVGNPSSPSVLNLGSNDKLLLQFDQLGAESNQFRISITHHNPDWSRSGLPVENYIDGFYEIRLNGGQISSNKRPIYRQYSFEFPTAQFRITKSGNYLLKVENTDTGYLVFSIPFFVSENAGSIVSSVEELSVPRQDLRRLQRPVCRYILPDFVDQPQFDLEFYFVQNRFWGRSRQADEVDFSGPDHVQFELSRDEAFIGDYEFRNLSLDQLSLRDNDVEEAFLSEIPPKLVLFDDAEGFSRTVSNSNIFGRLGRPDMNLNAGYANVVFRFDFEPLLDRAASVHLLGDFNNWSVSSNNKLVFDEETSRWQTSLVIKKGNYNYKYVVVDDAKIDDLYFDDLFRNDPQQYQAFVYMRDSKEFYYRLLQVQTFFSE